jgi:hypothetical protein
MHVRSHSSVLTRICMRGNTQLDETTFDFRFTRILNRVTFETCACKNNVRIRNTLENLNQAKALGVCDGEEQTSLELLPCGILGQQDMVETRVTRRKTTPWQHNMKSKHTESKACL